MDLTEVRTFRSLSTPVFVNQWAIVQFWVGHRTMLKC